MNLDITSMQLSTVISSLGGLGAASAAAVDALKTIPGGGVSNFGFNNIRFVVNSFLRSDSENSALESKTLILNTLHGNWINGKDSASQQQIAKSLIKLKLVPDNAASYAKATQVDERLLSLIAKDLLEGRALSPTVDDLAGMLPDQQIQLKQLAEQKVDIFNRFDLMLTQILESSYQKADQCYRNSCQLLAAILAMFVAGIAGYTIDPNNLTLYLLCGFISIPFAPLAKNLTSAVAAGADFAKSMKK